MGPPMTSTRCSGLEPGAGPGTVVCVVEVVAVAPATWLGLACGPTPAHTAAPTTSTASASKSRPRRRRGARRRACAPRRTAGTLPIVAQWAGAEGGRGARRERAQPLVEVAVRGGDLLPGACEPLRD